MEEFLFGIIIGAAVAVCVVGLSTNFLTNESWLVESVAHGYAHFDKDHSWHWNDEVPKP